MNKRLLAILLSVLMLTTVMLSGCGKEDDTTINLNADSTNTRTVVITAVTGKSTTAEAIAKVQDAMNVVSKQMYKTQVILNLKTEDEYEKYIVDTNKKLAKAEEEQSKAEMAARKEEQRKKKEQAAIDAKKKIKTKWATTTASTEETSEVQETQTDEYGRVVLKYPDAAENQLDIILMTNVDMFYEFYENDYLTALDDINSNAQKDLSKYIYPTFMSAGKINTAQYAIPTNQPLGTYTYFKINRALADQYNLQVGENMKLEDISGFLDSVKANNPGVTPINEVPKLDGLYFLTDEDTPIGTIVKSSYQDTKNVVPENLYKNETYVNYEILKSKWEKGGYVNANASQYAVEVVHGYLGQCTTDDNSYVTVYSTPRATNETLYSGIFGISSYCQDPSRAYEIINLLNTDSTFRNAFGYGIENENYELKQVTTTDADGNEEKIQVVHKLNDDYSMRLDQTGNMYIAYIPEGYDYDVWKASKEQNLNTYAEPFYHVTISQYAVSTETQREILNKNISNYEALCKQYVSGLHNADDVGAYLATAAAALDGNSDFQKNMLSMESTDTVIPVAYCYQAYMQAREATTTTKS